MSEQSKKQRDRQIEHRHAKEEYEKFVHIAILCLGLAVLMVVHVVIKIITSTPDEFSMAGDLALPLGLSVVAAIGAAFAYSKRAKPARTKMKRFDDSSVPDA